MTYKVEIYRGSRFDGQAVFEDFNECLKYVENMERFVTCLIYKDGKLINKKGEEPRKIKVYL